MSLKLEGLEGVEPEASIWCESVGQPQYWRSVTRRGNGTVVVGGLDKGRFVVRLALEGARGTYAPERTIDLDGASDVVLDPDPR